MQQLNAIVEEVKFSNEENGFGILKVRTEKQELLTCIGTLAMLRPGESVTLKGEHTTDPKWGKQFRTQSFEYRTDAGEAEILFMLSSGLVEGIGPKRAEAMVKLYGKETLTILEGDVERLKKVPGIGKIRAQKIVRSWQKKQAIRSLVLFLRPYGISLPFINRIHNLFGEEAKAKLSENPYILIEKLRGVGFKKADAIAQSIGYDAQSYRRLRAGILHVLHEAEGEGHLYLIRQELLARTAELTEVSGEKIDYSLDHIINETMVIEEDDRIYLKKLFDLETECAELFRERLSAQKKILKSDPLEAKIEKWAIKECESRKIEINEQQLSAVYTSVSEKIMLLTGGPGTGKTTTVRMIVDKATADGKKVLLTAPTGRAAQKMGEVARREGKTIHRLLEYTMGPDGGKFERNKLNPLKADIIIVDEFSMVDIRLAVALLRAVPPKAHLILVGDPDQLPSVGAGAILEHLIKCKVIPHVSLTTIFRQAEKSRIVTAAHEICHGTVPVFANGKEDNCFFLQRDTPEDALATIQELVCKRLPETYKFDPTRDIQVITAMHKGDLGTEAINKMLQSQLNPNKQRSVTRGDRTYATGDKVMQTKNNYDKQIFNGDIGFITGIEEDEVFVTFPNIKVTLSRSELDSLTHAYCISIHKSQGSEFPALVIPLTTQHFVMLRRKLIYTALTRAKQLCIFVGSTKALELAVNNRTEVVRNSRLSSRILGK